jgi:NAD(P)-dependent dehydrogenase (short-subunit alcohol dehydrogenase family)
LGDAGANIVVCGRSEETGRKVSDSIRETGTEAIFEYADVSNPKELRRLINVTITEFDGIDILVNNAGFETDTAPEELELDIWTQLLDTDLRAYWLLAKYAYPYLVESDAAAVVNISSNHSFATQPKKFPYNVVKAGIDSMTRAMAISWGVDGIRVNSVNPGWTMVDRIDDSLSDEELEHLERIHPLERIGTPDDVADAVLYLVSDMAKFVTGESHVVDGGRTAILQDDLYLRDHGFSDSS